MCKVTKTSKVSVVRSANASSEKKFLKPLKNCFLGGPISTKLIKGVIMGHTQNGEKFFGRNNKTRSSAFRYLFYQNIICFD